MEDSSLVLVAGHLDGHRCHGIVYVRTILEAILVEMRRRSLAVLENPSVREDCRGDCRCPSDGGLR